MPFDDKVLTEHLHQRFFKVDLKTRGLGIEQIWCLFNFGAKHINLKIVFNKELNSYV